MAQTAETVPVKFLDVTRPVFTIADAERLARDLYGIAAQAKEFYSERDRIFHLKASDGREHVLKLVHPDEDEATLDFQIQALNWIAREDVSLALPRVIRDKSGGQLCHTIDTAGRRHAVWMLDYLPGVPLMEAKPRPAPLREVGSFAARVDIALAGYFHPAAGREIVWDARHTPRLRPQLALLEDKADRAAAERVIDRFAADCLPRLSSLRAQVIHNDINFHNLLVNEQHPQRITGLIDFGDMVHGPLVLELANSGSEAAMETDRPIEAIAELVAGYHAHLPMTAADITQLFDLVQVRQALTLAVLATRRQQITDDPSYVEVYAVPCRDALHALEAIGRDKATAAFQRVIEPARSVILPRIAESEIDADRARMLAWRKRVMGPQTYMFYDKPLHMVRGEGAWLTDITGRRYLDVYNNVPHVGHCHPHVVEAIARQASILNTNTRYLFDEVLQFAERLSAQFPAGLTSCMFVNSGSEAVDLGWRLAKAFTGNTGALVMEYAYHGWTDAVEALSPEMRAGHDRPHVRKLIGPDDYRGPYRRGANDIAERYAADADRAIASLAEGGHKPAMFIADAGFLTNGVLDAPKGYLQGVYDRVRKAGGLCIADEVQTGFGRQGEAMWGFQLHGVTPDIVCMGKPIGNGHPLGAVVTRPEIVQALVDQGIFFSTFGGNNVSCAAGLAVLDVLEREG
ncbi:MAG TPA: aminotransferase class III-fold pyridoxal phosphate-dependent enzyme, partial [Dongiaceae bacterium]|nr:aminotransferase class III-fold pyridoxal phosphate-dependent enzyme [Dongiaceae bacterium]